MRIEGNAKMGTKSVVKDSQTTGMARTNASNKVEKDFIQIEDNPTEEVNLNTVNLVKKIRKA